MSSVYIATLARTRFMTGAYLSTAITFFGRGAQKHRQSMGPRDPLIDVAVKLDKVL
jgi:hypothetical protein